jgi:hypothetical protein
MKCTFDIGHAEIVGITKAGYWVRALEEETIQMPEHLKGARVISSSDIISNEPAPCWLIIPRSHWKKMFAEWTRDKEDYCKRYNELCGVGYIEVDSFLVGTDGYMYEDSGTRLTVNIYKSTGEFDVQMEHG